MHWLSRYALKTFPQFSAQTPDGGSAEAIIETIRMRQKRKKRKKRRKNKKKRKKKKRK